MASARRHLEGADHVSRKLCQPREGAHLVVCLGRLVSSIVIGCCWREATPSAHAPSRAQPMNQTRIADELQLGDPVPPMGRTRRSQLVGKHHPV